MRRTVLALLHGKVAPAMITAGTGSTAQRPARPISRPPRPGDPNGPGRFPRLTDGVIRVQPPGVFVVRAVNIENHLLQLSDSEGRSGTVYVDPDLFDVSELKPGDEIVVDFFVPADSSARLEAAGVWKK